MPNLPGYLNVFLNLRNSIQNYPKGIDEGHLSVWEMIIPKEASMPLEIRS